MNEITNEKLMTTKEIAEQLGTRPNVITENAKKCLPDKVIENGKTTYWTQAEVTVLLEFMKSNNNRTDLDLSNRVIGTSTELTPALKLKKALELAQEAYEEELQILRAKTEEQERTIAEQKPKALAYDEFVSRGKFCNFRDAANYLHTKQGTFMSLLKSKYIYKNEADEYRCYSQYSNYFALRPFTVGDRTRQQLMLTLEGLNFFRNKIGGEQA